MMLRRSCSPKIWFYDFFVKCGFASDVCVICYWTIVTIFCWLPALIREAFSNGTPLQQHEPCGTSLHIVPVVSGVSGVWQARHVPWTPLWQGAQKLLGKTTIFMYSFLNLYLAPHARDVTSLGGARDNNQVWLPVFEPEVFPKQMYCTE